MENLTDLEVVAELWKRRVQFLWDSAEMPGPVDIDLLDAMIDAFEASQKAAEAHGKREGDAMRKRLEHK